MGFTIVELLVAMAIMVILVAMLLTVLSRTRAAGYRVACLSNLHNLALTFRLYEQDNDGHLPDPGQTQIAWEQSLRKYASAGIFRCPADEELGPATGSSYDWRDTGQDATTLAGRSLSDARRANVVFVFDALPTWHAKQRMNVAFADGSTFSMSEQQCVDDLQCPIMPSLPLLKLP